MIGRAWSANQPTALCNGHSIPLPPYRTAAELVHSAGAPCLARCNGQVVDSAYLGVRISSTNAPAPTKPSAYPLVGIIFMCFCNRYRRQG